VKQVQLKFWAKSRLRVPQVRQGRRNRLRRHRNKVIVNWSNFQIFSETGTRPSFTASMEQRNTTSNPDVTGPITDCISVSNVTNSQQNTSIARISSSHSRSGGASPQMNDVKSSDERCRLDWREKTLNVIKVAVIILQYNILPRTQNTSAFLLFCDRGSFPSNY